MLNENALCSINELKGFMNLDIFDTSKDWLYEVYINAASDAIEKEVGRYILAKDYIEKYAGTNTNELVLKQRPVNSVEAISFVNNGEVYCTLEENTYTVEAKSGVIYNDNGWFKQGSSILMSRKITYPTQHIKVEYNAGYAEAPGDLKLICLQICSDSYTFDNSDAGKLKAYSISDVKEEYRDDVRFSDMQLKTIKKYKGMRF
jgi:hypothetical protein